MAFGHVGWDGGFLVMQPAAVFTGAPPDGFDHENDLSADGGHLRCQDRVEVDGESIICDSGFLGAGPT